MNVTKVNNIDLLDLAMSDVPDAGRYYAEIARRLAAAEWLAASVIDLLHEAAGYDASWSVPQFLADEPAVIALRRALAEWQALDEQAKGGDPA
jgi:hypothetical protein